MRSNRRLHATELSAHIVMQMRDVAADVPHDGSDGQGAKRKADGAHAPCRLRSRKKPLAMTTYTVKTSDGCQVRIKSDPSRPKATILMDTRSVAGDEEEYWGATPYHSADATDAEHAARLVQEWLDDGAALISVSEDRMETA